MAAPTVVKNFNEGWFVKIENPSIGVIGRSVGEGVLLPDVENDSQPPQHVGR